MGGREGPDQARRWRETISEAMKRTILISMCPNDVQDRAIQRVHGSKGYTEMRDKLLLVVRNRGPVTNVGGPVLMNDGEVDPEKLR